MLRKGDCGSYPGEEMDLYFWLSLKCGFECKTRGEYKWNSGFCPSVIVIPETERGGITKKASSRTAFVPVLNLQNWPACRSCD